MATMYDLYITTKGFFNLFGQRMHVPGAISGIEENELEILDSLGWEYYIVRTYDTPTTVEILFSNNIRRFICETESDLDKIRGIRNNDEVLIKDSGKLFFYQE